MKRGAAIITCEPSTIAAVAAVVSTAVGGYSAYQSGQSRKDAGEDNAEVQRQQSSDALQRGAIEGAAKRDKARRIAASQAEAAAMSNLAINTGTPLALLTETAGLGELDALTTLNNAQREAWGYKASSQLEQYQGKAAGRAGVLNAGGTFLGGASSAYYGYKGATK